MRTYSHTHPPDEFDRTLDRSLWWDRHKLPETYLSGNKRERIRKRLKGLTETYRKVRNTPKQRVIADKLLHMLKCLSRADRTYICAAVGIKFNRRGLVTEVRGY